MKALLDQAGPLLGDMHPWAGEQELLNGGRRLLETLWDTSEAFRISVIVISSVLGAVLLVGLVWLVVACMRSKAQVAPMEDKDKVVVGQAGVAAAPEVKSSVAYQPLDQQQSTWASSQQPQQQQQLAANGQTYQQSPFEQQTYQQPVTANTLPGAITQMTYERSAPPPLDLNHVRSAAMMPPGSPYGQTATPGVVLAPTIPPVFAAATSNPRPPTADPFERLVIISSRVWMANTVAEAVLPNVAVVVYDWKNFTLQELLRYIKKTVGIQKLTSIAVVAPGSKPGTVSLLDGCTTSAASLADKSEMSQFWKVLAGQVAVNAVNDGRRIDLLGCRVIEHPREGALLLRELWKLTAVPFAAADDPLGGYSLATFMEEPSTGQVSLISSTIQAIDLYFNRYSLQAIPEPGSPGAQEAATASMAGAPDLTRSSAYMAPLPPGLMSPQVLTPWGPSQYYAVRNCGTGRYLAARPDGQLVAESDVPNSHELVWSIVNLPSGGVALASHYSKYLAVDAAGTLPNNLSPQAGAPETVWRIDDRGGNLYSLRGASGTWLSAVLPVQGQHSVALVPLCLQPETWEITPITPPPVPGAAQVAAAAAVGPRWGVSDFYSVRNCATARYLSAQPDGRLVAESDVLSHEDMLWTVVAPPSGGPGGVALTSCHARFLTIDGTGAVPSNLAPQGGTPETTWRIDERGGNLYSLRCVAGTWLSAGQPPPPPATPGQQQQQQPPGAVALAPLCLQSETWEILPAAPPSATGAPVVMVAGAAAAAAAAGAAVGTAAAVAAATPTAMAPVSQSFVAAAPATAGEAGALVPLTTQSAGAPSGGGFAQPAGPYAQSATPAPYAAEAAALPLASQAAAPAAFGAQGVAGAHAGQAAMAPEAAAAADPATAPWLVTPTRAAPWAPEPAPATPPPVYERPLEPAAAAAAGTMAAIGALQPLEAVSSSPPQAQAAAVPANDIFSRFIAGCHDRQLSVSEVFRAYDQNKNGQLEQAEILVMFRDVVPGASDADIKHFKAMLDVDKSETLSEQELVQGLDKHAQISSVVAAGYDDNDVLARLMEYLTLNEELLRSIFVEYDQDQTGRLDHNELQELVAGIPGLDADEQKYIMVYLHQHDKDGDGKLSYDELLQVIRSYNGPPPIHQAVAMNGAGAVVQPQYNQPPQQQQQQHGEMEDDNNNFGYGTQQPQAPYASGGFNSQAVPVGQASGGGYGQQGPSHINNDAAAYNPGQQQQHPQQQYGNAGGYGGQPARLGDEFDDDDVGPAYDSRPGLVGGGHTAATAPPPPQSQFPPLRQPQSGGGGFDAPPQQQQQQQDAYPGGYGSGLQPPPPQQQQQQQQHNSAGGYGGQYDDDDLVDTNDAFGGGGGPAGPPGGGRSGWQPPAPAGSGGGVQPQREMGGPNNNAFGY